MLKRIQERCHPKMRVYQIYPLPGHGCARRCWPRAPGVKQISTDTDLYTAAMMTSEIAEIHAGDFAQLDTELQCQDEAISAARNPVGFARITKEANRLTPV